MQQYLLLKKITVQNANAIAGLTYGFPAITNFLGFAHALSRGLSKELNISLEGVVVVSHKNTIHVRQPKGWGDFVFALSRNPLAHDGKTAPINEEGRMHMEISLLIEVKGLIAGDHATGEELIQQIKSNVYKSRIAGGQITSIESIELAPLDEDSKTFRRLMPGFALIDRSDYLAKHHEKNKLKDDNACLFDSWCDFTQIKFKAEKAVGDDGESDKGEWAYIAKPNPGYLVPIASGYRAISQVYEPGEVEKVRDASVPAVFAETAYSVGEWKSVHALNNGEQAIWRYSSQHPWYLATSTPFEEEFLEPDMSDGEDEMVS